MTKKFKETSENSTVPLNLNTRRPKVDGENKITPLKIMLGDLNYINDSRGAMLAVPINIGYIGQYANQEFGNDVDISLYKDPDEFLYDLKENKPNIVAFSQYIWNADLNRVMIKKIRNIYGKDVLIVLGGPSTDVEDWEKKYLLQDEFDADALVLEEGEVPFSNIIRSYISNRESTLIEPLDGVVFLRDNDLIHGVNKTVQTDLNKLNSPYLSGILDKFLHSNYMPLIQMSRFCPYQCAFCTAGKIRNRGKIRAFPIEMIKEEIYFISKIFSDRPHFTLQVSDENFGLLKRDVEIAKYVRKCADENHFPRQMFYYSDKRFTDTVRSILLELGSINLDGLQISLQTGNAKTLEVVKRKNLTEEEVDQGIAWAVENGIHSYTELIFGLPYETLETYCSALDNCAKRGFDVIIGYTLWLMAGIPLNTIESRELYKIKTKYRILASAYGEHDGDFSCEHEEIVVSTSTLSEHDFQVFRQISFLFYAVYAIGFYRLFIQGLINHGVSMTKFFMEFMSPDMSGEWPDEYIQFIADFDKTVNEEIFDTREELEEYMKKSFYENNKKTVNPTRINVLFGGRLVYMERSWVKDVMEKHLIKLLPACDESTLDMFSLLLEIGEKERIDIRNHIEPLPINTSYDILSWKKERFKKKLTEYHFKSKTIKFSIRPEVNETIKSFVSGNEYQDDDVFYYNAVDNIVPRGNQLYDQTY